MNPSLLPKDESVLISDLIISTSERGFSEDGFSDFEGLSKKISNENFPAPARRVVKAAAIKMKL